MDQKPQVNSKSFMDKIEFISTISPYLGLPAYYFTKVGERIHVELKNGPLNIAIALLFTCSFSYCSIMHSIKLMHAENEAIALTVLNCAFVLWSYFNKFICKNSYREIMMVYLEIQGDLERLNFAFQESQSGIMNATSVRRTGLLLMNSGTYCYLYYVTGNDVKLYQLFTIFVMFVFTGAFVSYFVFNVRAITRCNSQLNYVLQNITLAKMANISPYTTTKQTHDILFKNDGDVVSKKLQDIAKTILKQHQIVDKLNKLLGAEILSMCSSSFILFALNMYRMLSTLMLIVNNTTQIHFEQLPFFIARITHAILWGYGNIHYIVWACVKYEKEASRTPMLIHQIMNTNISPAVTHKAAVISMQLLHGVPKFTACDLFPLDYTLIMSVVSFTTTYLVTLIQS